MDRKLFKFKNIAIVAVFSLIAIVGFSAFKGELKRVETERVLVPQWYSLSITGSLPVNQIIGTEETAKPNSPSCRSINTGDRCAVEISFVDVVPPIAAVTGKSVSFVLANYSGSSVTDFTKRNP